MPSPVMPVPIDQAAEAGHLADLFNDLSQALDDFRLAPHNPPISANQLARLKSDAQSLEDRAHYFTAQAIGATLQMIQPELANIKAITAKAKTQVGTLNNVSKVISIATSAMTLGTAIAAGNTSSIATALAALGKSLA